jgi:hypothetical protein
MRCRYGRIRIGSRLIESRLHVRGNGSASRICRCGESLVSRSDEVACGVVRRVLLHMQVAAGNVDPSHGVLLAVHVGVQAMLAVPLPLHHRDLALPVDLPRARPDGCGHARRDHRPAAAGRGLATASSATRSGRTPLSICCMRSRHSCMRGPMTTMVSPSCRGSGSMVARSGSHTSRTGSTSRSTTP